MIGQAEQDTAAFAYNAMASLAKAVAFRSLAIQALKTNERINATVCAYYSLLHLAITLIYLCPDKIEAGLRYKLRAKRGQGGTDPSKLILHESALEFVKLRVQDGLDDRFYAQLKYAKDLREFVNYGPRLTINDETPEFGPCTYQPNDCGRLISVIDEIFLGALEWAGRHSPLGGAIAKMALAKCSEFFIQPDLFYAQWCSKACIENSLEFLRDLEQKMMQ